MVKLKGPVQSLRASGKLGGALVFAESKGRPYLKKLTKPKQPRSPVQVANRAFLNFLTKSWTELSSADQQSWETAAQTLNLDPYRAFVQYNLAQLTRDQLPTMNRDQPGGGTHSLISAETATPRQRTIALTYTATVYATAWGLVFARGLSAGFTPSIHNTKHLVIMTATGDFSWIDGPLPPGAYYYKTLKMTRYTRVLTWETFANATLPA